MRGYSCERSLGSLGLCVFSTFRQLYFVPLAGKFKSDPSSNKKTCALRAQPLEGDSKMQQ